MKNRIYNLDGLRFLAALIVLLGHIGNIKKFWGFKPFAVQQILNFNGQIAVTFFFVLSGFLIGYRLLIERANDPIGLINLKRFYIKRIKRIWPLYYLMIFLAFFVFRGLDPFNSSNFSSSLNGYRLTGYLLFSPNTILQFFGNQAYLGVTWSLGVEEFFYLIFPLLFLWQGHKNLSVVFISTAFLSITISILSRYLINSSENWKWHVIGNYIDNYRLYSFFLGAFASWHFFYRREKSMASKNNYYLIATYAISIIIIAGMLTRSGSDLYVQELYSVLFALFLYTLCRSGINSSLLNNPAMIYLGKISYGIYMYHSLVVVLTVYLLNIFLIKGMVAEMILYAGSVFFTIIISSASYKYLESPLINTKKTGKFDKDH